MNALNQPLPEFRLFFHAMDRKRFETATHEIETLLQRRVRFYPYGPSVAVELNDQLELDVLRKHFGAKANIWHDLRSWKSDDD